MLDENTKQAIHLLGIYELRTLARNVGVASPTTLKRQELLRQIEEIMSGSKQVEKSSGMGRPPKATKLDASVMDIFVPKDFIKIVDDDEKRKKQTLSNKLIFNQDIDWNKFDIKTEETCKGYLRKTTQNAHYLFTADRMVYVPPTFIENGLLLEGDYLVARSWRIKDKPYDILTSIKSINGNNLQDWERKIADFSDVVLHNNEFEGTKHYEHFEEKDVKGYLTKIAPILKKCEKEGYKINVLAAGLPPEGVLKIRLFLRYTEFFSLFENDAEISHDIIYDAINHTTSLARSGEKVLLFVYDLSSVMSELNTDMWKKSHDISNEAISGVRKIFCLNRVLSNGGSITTIIGTSDKKEEFESFFR